MITAAEARLAGPGAGRKALLNSLHDHIWRSIYAGTNTVSMKNACSDAGLDYKFIDHTSGFESVNKELEALGYKVSAEGIVSW
jgi:hypothetical protein